MYLIVKKSAIAIAIAIAIAVLALIFLFITHRSDSRAYDCTRSTSPNGRYIAEECTLDWNRGDNPKYVGRVFDAASGKLIARQIFRTPVPEIMWGDSYLLFQRGGDGEGLVNLPPSRYERINAAYWQLTQW
ncbi:hypothetical protein [Paraburkholderia pallida]|uniref:Uncharacterized protein n=1 Tax=Paraburkholderia pallida TaxID=2547399 RepID=A0A4P7CRI2_9BURK|nr:hypothetical protein [Paraburkholderia pallida]QBQ96353.1 hypothetical protein E1956_03640 [Paraburkholderia pallida]